MQRLPRAFSLRANANYYSSIVIQQTYQQDITAPPIAPAASAAT